jgi:Dolichyl-phosphate-mannose-protein mannosyltransferase
MRARTVAAFLAVTLAAPALADGPFTIAIPGDGAPAGEVGFFDATGRHLGRLTGLGEPAHLAPAGDDRFLVLDRATGRLLELDADGHVTRDQKCPPENPHPDRAALLENGHILLAAEFRATEVDAAGKAVAVFDAPRGIHLLGAARLADGSTIFSSTEEPEPILRRAAGATAFEHVPLGEGYAHARYSLRLEAAAPSSSGFLLWHHDFETVRRMAVESGRITAKGSWAMPLAWKVTADPAGGIVGICDSFEIRRVAADRTSTRFRVPFAPLGAVYLPGRDLYAVSYVRVPAAAWPDSWLAGASATRFPWSKLALFTLFGIAVGGAVFFARGHHRDAAPGAGTSAALPVSPPDVSSAGQAAPMRRLASTGAAFVPLVLYGAALVLSRRGVLQLDALFQPERDVPLLLGFGLALAAAVWDRVATRRRDPYWQAVLAAPAEDRRLLLVLFGGAAVLAAGMALLYRWRAARAEADAACLWAGLHVIVFAMVAASFRGRVHLLAAARAHWPVVVPLVAACVTLFYRLLDVPTNIHFDFVYTSLSALELLDGRLQSIFQAGFVPVPVVGLLPETAGFLLAGPTETGFRLGPALAGVSGVLAVYVLGTTWRGRATGLLGAIFLSGAAPWIHFNRLSATGVSAVAGLWLLVFFALALKTNRAGWWLLGGWVAGWCFYLWPASRVAPVACFLAGLVLAVRSPRATARRWAGPPLMALVFLLWIVPLLPAWVETPSLALPRAQETLEVYKPQGGLNHERLRASFGRPLAMSAGWFFATPDQSSQGSMSPALNTAEATLLVVGVALALAAGFSLNVLLVLFAALVLLVLGAFAGSPPWYTRMLPSLPIACTFMGAAASQLIDTLRLPGRRARGAALALAAACALALSPAVNLRRYVAYELQDRPMWEATALGRRLRTLGPGRTVYLVTTDRPDWSLDVRNGGRPPRLGEMLPYVWNLHLVEIPELEEGAALAAGPKAIVVPRERIATDVPRLLTAWPRARVETLPGVGGPWAQILLID